jgi:hypothetical protein
LGESKKIFFLNLGNVNFLENQNEKNEKMIFLLQPKTKMGANFLIEASRVAL